MFHWQGLKEKMPVCSWGEDLQFPGTCLHCAVSSPTPPLRHGATATLRGSPERQQRKTLGCLGNHELGENKITRIVTRMSKEGHVDEEKGFRTLRPCDKWTPLDGPVSAGQAVSSRSTVWSILRVSDSFLPQLLPVFIQQAFKDGGRAWVQPHDPITADRSACQP